MTWSPSRRSLLRAAIAGAALALAGCGRKGSPIPPPDADPKAPRIYPVDRSLPPAQRGLPPAQQQPVYPPPPEQQPQFSSPFINPLDQRYPQ